MPDSRNFVSVEWVEVLSNYFCQPFFWDEIFRETENVTAVGLR